MMLISIPGTVFAGDTTAALSDNQSVEYFSDGTYMLTEIESSGISARAALTITAVKSVKCYNKTGILQQYRLNFLT